MMHLPEKALTIRQPWAWAIAFGGKDIENRDWATSYRGPICIHAGANKNRDYYEEAAYFMHFNLDPQVVAPLMGNVAFGGIIATAEIVDCVEQSDSPWFFGRYGFVLANVQPVPFLPCKGALGLFDWRKVNGMVLQ